MPKIVGIDYGTKRVGIAVSDESGSIAFPKTTLTNDRSLLPAIIELIRRENATTVVFGDSRDWDGVENKVMEDARAFCKDLQRSVAVSVHFEPEFYSSVEARKHTGKTIVDAEAAAIILNSYLSKIKQQ